MPTWRVAHDCRICFVFMLIPTTYWRLSDKIGRRTSMLCFGSLATILPFLFSALQNVSSPYAAFGLVMCALLIVSFYTSISGILKAEMFPAQVRALGVGLSHAVANAIFGGSAEYVALSLKSRDGNSLLLVCDLDGRGMFLVSLTLHVKEKGCGFSDGSVARRYSRCLHRRYPVQNPSSSSRSLRAAIPKLF